MIVQLWKLKEIRHLRCWQSSLMFHQKFQHYLKRMVTAMLRGLDIKSAVLLYEIELYYNLLKKTPFYTNKMKSDLFTHILWSGCRELIKTYTQQQNNKKPAFHYYTLLKYV